MGHNMVEYTKKVRVEKMTGNNIQVALSSDDNYFVGLLTTAWSIARNCSRPHNLIFHIIDGGISDAN